MVCREPLWNGRQSDEEVVGMLLGYKPLPWEGNPAHLSQHVHSHAAAQLVRHLLRYEAKADRSLSSRLL